MTGGTYNAKGFSSIWRHGVAIFLFPWHSASSFAGACSLERQGQHFFEHSCRQRRPRCPEHVLQIFLINKPRGGNAIGFFQQVFGNDHSCILKCRCLSKLLSSFVMVFWLGPFALMFVTVMAFKFHLCFESFCGDFFLFFLLLLRWLLFIVV